jgi:hypothetical protein
MPRRTAEERATAFYRVRAQPVAPLEGMSPAARVIWAEIISSKAPDYFDAGALQILRVHCEAIAGAARVLRDLDQFALGSGEHMRACSVWKIFANQANTTARQLRLTIQNAVHTQSAKITERSAASNVDQRLLGGREAA